MLVNLLIKSKKSSLKKPVLINNYSNKIIFFINLLLAFKIFFLFFITINYFSTNFDITDESFSLYRFVQNHNIENTCTMYIMLNYLGSLWDQDIYIWRIFTLIFVAISTVINSSVLINYFFSDLKINIHILEKVLLIQLTLIVSFCIFAWHPTLDYNLLPILISSYWISFSIIYLKTIKPLHRFVLILLISFTIYLIFPIKFPISILLFIVTFFIISYKSKYKFSSDLIILIMFNIILYFILFFIHDSYAQISMLAFSSATTNEGSHGLSMLSQKYYEDFLNFLMCCLVHPSLIIILFFSTPRSIYHKLCKRNHFIDLFSFFILSYFLYSIISNPLLSYISEYSLNRMFYGIILGLVIMLFLQIKNQLTTFSFQIIVFILLVQFHAVGTNTVLLTLTSLSISSLFLIFILFLRIKTNSLIPIVFISTFCFVYSASLLHKYQKSNYRRNASHEHQTFNTYKGNILNNLKIEKDLGLTINSIKSKLSVLDFNEKKDYIWGFPDIPGLVLALQANALGSSWNITGYANSDDLIKKQTLSTLKDIQNDSNIYILLDKNFSSSLTMLAFIENHLTRKNNFIECNVGNFYHHRNQNFFNCFLLGPYSRSTDEI